MSEPERRITAIERQKRNPLRVNLFLDGEFAFGLPAEVVQERGLRWGDVLSPTDIQGLKDLDELGAATDSAIRLLTSRPRSIREIRDRLRQKAYADETIDRVIERLRDWRYVDDEAFARYWIENRESHRPRGLRVLQQELRTKGIEREVVSAAIDDAGVDERAGALAIARGKLHTYQSLERPVARRRMAAMLARRGYSYGVVKPVLDEVFGDSEDDAELD